MRDNLIHNFRESDSENLLESVPKTIKETLGVSPKSKWKTKTITGKLKKFSQKEIFLKAQREKKDAGVEQKFHITPQSPTPVFEHRKKLQKISSTFRKDKDKHRISGNKIIFENGVESFPGTWCQKKLSRSGKIYESYQDDYDYGAGRKLLKYLQIQGLMDCAFVVLGWFGGRHIGPKPFFHYGKFCCRSCK
ncbi:hypothetical protein KUTeg_010978 [Tegillarca granosa]|uniref:Impact N-terminal domain-containing protein n=1 Tax=Tegillarca granosa TaxID=220873 RepID=A0ABQ9F7L8_TEGGR|nr:hypothetical protein KUTeg_010978 [Tegillarca granosa]